jgi:hypothetical protein
MTKISKKFSENGGFLCRTFRLRKVRGLRDLLKTRLWCTVGAHYAANEIISCK